MMMIMVMMMIISKIIIIKIIIIIILLIQIRIIRLLIIDHPQDYQGYDKLIMTVYDDKDPISVGICLAHLTGMMMMMMTMMK